MSKIDLEIIIVTYNSEFWLKKLLISLEKFYLSQTKSNVQITVVDNDSEDNTQQMLKSQYKKVKFLKTSTNVGFAAANNLALKDSQAKYVMLLNSDTELNEDSKIDDLLKYLDKNSKVGIVTPRLEYVTGRLDLASHRGEPTIWASFTYFSKLEQLFPKLKLFGQYHQTYKDFLSTHEIDACSGAAMVIKKSALDKVGLLDERFFMYAEDLDICRRFREAGWKIMYLPEVKIIHHKNKSGIQSASQKLAIKTKQHFYDTMLQYYDKYYGKKYPSFVRGMIKFYLIIKKGAL